MSDAPTSLASAPCSLPRFFSLLDTRGKPAPPAVRTIRAWLDTWRGLGEVVTGMSRQGYMVHLSNVDASTWRATFSPEVMLSADGFGTGPTPWRAVQVAAWDALGKPREDEARPRPVDDTELPKRP